MRCVDDQSAASFCCSATCSASVGHLLCLLCSHESHCGQVRFRGCNLTGKRCIVCAGVHNLGSIVLDSGLRRSKNGAQGFVLVDGDSLQGLGALKQCALRQNEQSLLEPCNSAARLCDFSPYVTTLAIHVSFSLARYSTTADNSAFPQSLSLIDSSADFLNPELSCS